MRGLTRFLSAFTLIVGLTSLSVACSGASTEDIQGMLQAAQGKEIIIKLDDGTVVKIEVEQSQANIAQKLVGEEVQVKARVDDNGIQTAVKVEDRSREKEDQHLTGAITLVTPDKISVAGKDFKVTANTILDSGLKPGATARVEFITLRDGTLLAKEIEADEHGFRLSGNVDSITEDSIKVAGKSFDINPSSRLDDGIKAGEVAKVEFEKLDDNSLLAIRVVKDDKGVDLNKMRYSGEVEARDDKNIVVDGHTFKISDDTQVDDSVAKGKLAEIEFEIENDGSFVARHAQLDDGTAVEDAQKGGSITSIGSTSAVVGGQTFTISPVTRLDSGLASGVDARVEFITLSDGSLLATSIETDVDDTKVSGALQSMNAYAFVVDGQTFAVNAATRIDNGLVNGAEVRVEFITLADGTKLATEIETALREDELRGREAEGEGARGEEEARGREAEGEGARGEGELRGREAEGEGPSGEGENEAGDDKGGGSGSGSSGSGSSGSGSGG